VALGEGQAIDLGVDDTPSSLEAGGMKAALDDEWVAKKAVMVLAEG
jgi:hypothetical protein